MEKYIFSKNLSVQERKWILECIEYVKTLYIPISKNIYFKHSTGFKEIGWCKTEKDSVKAECTIGLSIYLTMHEGDTDFKETCIHELLHTIKNQSKNPHKGSWKKYADYINSLYKWDDPINRFHIDELFLKNNLKLAKRNYKNKRKEKNEI